MKAVTSSVGVPVHKETEGEGLEALGAVIPTDTLRVGVPRSRAVLLVLATEHVLLRGMVSAKALERIVGLWGWCLLFAGPGLAILDDCYALMRRLRNRGVGRTPLGVRRELECLC